MVVIFRKALKGPDRCESAIPEPLINVGPFYNAFKVPYIVPKKRPSLG